MRVMNNRNSIKEEFTKIDRYLDENLMVYLMGGWSDGLTRFEERNI